MNNIKSFTFYRNYYELIKYLDKDERLKLYDAMTEYIFEDKEPQLENLSNGIWINLKMPLETSKNNAGRGGRPKKEKTEKKPIENRLITDDKTEKKTNNISYFLFLISNNKYKYIKKDNDIYNKIYEWLEYKTQKKEKYTEIGLKKLITQIEKQVEVYGIEEICNLIDECMSNNYKGIIFDKLKNKKSQKQNPDWFGKNQDIHTITKQEEEEMESILTEMQQ